MDATRGSTDDAADTSGLLVDRCRGAEVAIVAFGGMAQALGMPPFEFFGQLRSIPAHRVFVRDHEQCWYHRGVAGISHDLASTTLALEETLASLAPRRVVCVGTSAGGYAALLFGYRLGVDEVLAFGPQVAISKEFRAAIGDERWTQEIAHLPDRAESHEARDLARVLIEPTGTTHRLYVGKRELLDVAHGRHLAGAPGVVLRELDASHNTAGHLRRTGALPVVLHRAATGRLSVPLVVRQAIWRTVRAARSRLPGWA
jgi:hypothetical protein